MGVAGRISMSGIRTCQCLHRIGHADRSSLRFLVHSRFSVRLYSEFENVAIIIYTITFYDICNFILSVSRSRTYRICTHILMKFIIYIPESLARFLVSARMTLEEAAR